AGHDGCRWLEPTPAADHRAADAGRTGAAGFAHRDANCPVSARAATAPADRRRLRAYAPARVADCCQFESWSSWPDISYHEALQPLWRPAAAVPTKCSYSRSSGLLMDKRHPSLVTLQAFEATVRLNSRTAAAAELGISQSAVSQRIYQLEEQLG